MCVLFKVIATQNCNFFTSIPQVLQEAFTTLKKVNVTYFYLSTNGDQVDYDFDQTSGLLVVSRKQSCKKDKCFVSTETGNYSNDI